MKCMKKNHQADPSKVLFHMQIISTKTKALKNSADASIGIAAIELFHQMHFANKGVLLCGSFDKINPRGNMIQRDFRFAV